MIDRVIPSQGKELGGFFVRRALPSARQRSVGPWVFFDHMGPAEFPPGGGMDVRPHPHINLATVTYLFEKRSNKTHQSTTDPGSKLYTKSKGEAAKLSSLFDSIS